MDFQFSRCQISGVYRIHCEMGFEIIARWLSDEIAQDHSKIAQIFTLITQAKQNPEQELHYRGREVSCVFNEFEVCIQSHGMEEEVELEESDWSLYDSESIAYCGLEDIEHLLWQWQSFIRSERA